jgi:tRNA-Thr(GGU) m(6)t(6)A37 methyltransferase TsaA
VKYTLEPVAVINTCFPEKFGIPRQSLLCPSAVGELILLPPYNQKEAVAGLEQVSHLWLSFIFHQHVDKQWKPKVRPPRLGGNKKLGVFATRSSFRPNNIGLSVVKLESIEFRNKNNAKQLAGAQDPQVILHVSGIDLLDGTPVIDIKPYVPYADCVAAASNLMASAAPPSLSVIFLESASLSLDNLAFNKNKNNAADLKQLIIEVLQQDPRPAYHAVDSARIYSMFLYNFDIKWSYRYDVNNLLNIDVVAIIDVAVTKIK